MCYIYIHIMYKMGPNEEHEKKTQLKRRWHLSSPSVVSTLSKLVAITWLHSTTTVVCRLRSLSDIQERGSSRTGGVGGGAEELIAGWRAAAEQTVLSVSDCLCQITLVNQNKVAKRVYDWLTCYESIRIPTRYLSTEDTTLLFWKQENMDTELIGGMKRN